MTVLKSKISWCTGTLNAWVGCDAVSRGCDHCFAKSQVERFGGDFGKVVLHPNRLQDIKKMRPQKNADGTLSPYLCFVNSMSDFWHSAVADETLHHVLDLFEEHPQTIFQILTKRPARMRLLLADRYAGRGIPAHIWIGVSVEDNDVAPRINFLRRLQDQVGTVTSFVSAEPIVGPMDRVDFSGIDWVILGGESGPGARKMERDWLMQAVDLAEGYGAALWLKQHGTLRSHPNLADVPDVIAKRGPARVMGWLVDTGLELLPEEKGGATLDRQVWRDMPGPFHDLVRELNPPRAA